MTESLQGLGNSFVTLICFVFFLNVGIIVLAIIAVVNTYQRIKNISENTDKVISYIEQTNSALSAQYTMEHCYMNRFQAHEWYPTGKYSQTEIEFRCSKCGQILNVHTPARDVPLDNNQFTYLK